jgi:hypothetical protein
MNSKYRLSVCLPLTGLLSVLTGCDAVAERLIPASYIERMVDARIGLRVKADSVVSDADREAASKSEAEKPDWERSNDFIRQLSKLMEGYDPKLPVIQDDTNVLECASTAAYKNDQSLVVAAKVLSSDVERARKNQNRIKRNFERRRFLQYRIDLNWEQRVASQASAWRCTEGSDWIDSADTCRYYDGDWYQIISDAFGNDEYDAVGQHLYSRDTIPQPPELMKRMEAAQMVPVERLHCRVTDIVYGPEREGSPQLIQCDGDVLRLRVFGAASLAHIGDVLSAPLAGTHRNPEGVLAKTAGRDAYWRLDLPGSDLKVESSVACKSDEQIGLVALSKLPPERQKNPQLVELIRRSPAQSVEGKRAVAEDDLRQRRWLAAAQGFDGLRDADGLVAASKGLARDKDLANAVTYLAKGIALKPDAALSLQLADWKFQNSDAAGAKADARALINAAADLGQLRPVEGLLRKLGDTEAESLVRARKCQLGDARSCG